MKYLNNPIAKGITVVFLIILIAFLLGGCEKQDIPGYVDKHDISFEAGNEETYTFADHHPDSLNKPSSGLHSQPQDYTVVKNGYQLGRAIKYSFWMQGDTVYVKAYHRIDRVKWYPHAATRHFEEVEVSDNGIFKHKVSGYFVVVKPWDEETYNLEL